MYRVIKASSSIREMIISVASGINASGFDVTIIEDGNEVFSKKYRYGYDASYDRTIARHAEKEHNNGIKYGWGRVPSLQPYVTDIIRDLCSKYGVNYDDIQVVNGRNTFKGNQVSDRKVQEFIDAYLSEL